MPEVKYVTRAQIRAAEILNDMGRGNDATRAIAAARRQQSAPPNAHSSSTRQPTPPSAR